MGMFKQLKDMKQMVDAAPGMVQQAQQLGAQAQQMAAAQQAAAQAQMAAMQGQMGGMPGAGPTGPDFEPIAGVSLEQYTAIAKALAAVHNDQSQISAITASHGVSAADWETASNVWASRIQANPAVGMRFNQLYRAG